MTDTHRHKAEIRDGSGALKGYEFYCGIRTDVVDTVFCTTDDWESTTCTDCLVKRHPDKTKEEEPKTHSHKWNALNLIKNNSLPSLRRSDQRLSDLKGQRTLLDAEIEKETIINSTFRSHIGDVEQTIASQEIVDGVHASVVKDSQLSP